MPFGLKLAGYAAALARSRERLRRLRKEALALQFGGAAGTLASLGENGLAVTDRLAALLDLPAPDAPWHAPQRPARRDRLGARDPHRHLRQDRARRRAADADRGRRSARAAARPRRRTSTLPHKRAPDRARRPASRPRPSRRTCSPPSSPARCRSTSAGSAAGRRNGMPCRRCCSSPPARSPPSPTSRRGSRSMPSACAAISTSRQGLIMVEAVTMALGAKLGPHQAQADRRGSEQAGDHRRSATSTASWPKTRASPRT